MTSQTLVGRVAEQATLAALADLAASGHGAIALLRGEPGIGKTTLVNVLLRHWANHRLTAYTAACWEMEQRRPFGVFADALRLRQAADPVRAQLDRLLRGDDQSRDPDAAEFQIARQILDYVEDAAIVAPVAIVVEDLQWADPPSLMVLGWLARLAAQLPVLLACTVRADAARPEVAALLATVDRAGAVRLDVGPLAEDAVAELVARQAGAPPSDRLLRTVAVAGGNPLYVTEILDALTAEGALTGADGGRVDVADGESPISLRQAVRRRLAAQPPGTVDLARAASVLGSAFTVDELAAVVSRPVAEIAGELQSAIDGGVFVAEETGLAFRHELVRAALYEEMPQVLRRARHREAARLLAEAGQRPDRVAAHWMAGAEAGDMQAVGWLRQTAGEIAHRSPGVAAELLQRAWELCPAGDPARPEIMAELVQPLAWASRQDELEALCSRALDGGGRPADAMMFRVGLAHALFIQGHLAAARAAYERAAEAVRADQGAFDQLTAYAALSAGMAGDVAAAREARSLGSAAVAAASGEAQLTRGIAFLATCVADLYGGRADRAAAGFDTLAAAGRADRWGLQLLRGAAQLDLDHLAAARTLLREGATECARTGTAARTALYHHNLVLVEYAAGDLESALAEHETGLALAQAFDHHWQGISLGVAAAIEVHRGELGRAAKIIAEAELQISSFGPHPADSEVARARFLLAQASQDAAAALAAAVAAWQLCDDHGTRSHLTLLAADLASAAVASGERSRAAEAVARAEQLAPELAASCWQGCAARARGIIDDDPQRLLDAVALLRPSRPLYLALALEDAAESLGRAGHVERARPLAAEALELFTWLGAVTDAARASRRWRVAGLRLGARGGRGRPKSGWESLSDSELRVIRIVAEGRTNREIAARLFVTVDTVHTHVSHALRKLGLSSRAELAAEAARRGL